MRRVAALLVCLSAAGAAAHPFDDPRTELLVALIAQAGCAMDRETADRVLPRHGFDRAESRAIVDFLMAMGRARYDPSRDAVILAPEECF